MKGLILKDIMTIKKEAKLFFIVIILYTIMGVATDNYGIMSIMGVLAVMTGTLASVTYDEKAGFDKFAIGIKLKYEEIVLSKYILSFISIFIVLVFTLGILLILKASPKDIMEIVSLIIIGSALICSFLIPLVFRFGTERARLILVMIIIVPSIAIANIQELLTGNLEFIKLIKFLNENAILLAIVASVIALIVSFFISLTIYRKKEF